MTACRGTDGPRWRLVACAVARQEGSAARQTTSTVRRCPLQRVRAWEHRRARVAPEKPAAHNVKRTRMRMRAVGGEWAGGDGKKARRTHGHGGHHPVSRWSGVYRLRVSLAGPEAGGRPGEVCGCTHPCRRTTVVMHTKGAWCLYEAVPRVRSRYSCRALCPTTRHASTPAASMIPRPCARVKRLSCSHHKYTL